MTNNNRPQPQPPLPPPPLPPPPSVYPIHADSPQCWFTNLDSQFATANITQSITKFHWAVAKLPFSLTPTIHPLARDPTAVADPYGRLKELLLESLYHCMRTGSTTSRGSSWASAQRPEKTTVPPPLRKCSARHSFYLANFGIHQKYLLKFFLSNSLGH